MVFNLNEFLMAVSFALDFVEIDILGVSSNHSKRVAYIALKLADVFKLTPEEKYDIVALSILHDNGASEKVLHDALNSRQMKNINILESIKEHCIIGEDNIKNYPFFTDVKNVIKYHHEKFNGQGFFNVEAKDIPLMAHIIGFADTLELSFDLKNSTLKIEKEVIKFVIEQSNNTFSPEVVEAFLKISKNKSFWMDLRDNYIDIVLRASIPQYTMDIPLQEILEITKVLSKIIDSKSAFTQMHSQGLATKVETILDFYGTDHEQKMKLMITAYLHDIGKLAVPNTILDSPHKLKDEDFDLIKEHPYYTGIVLREIEGFDEITQWASNHHERLDGSGYPSGLVAEELDFGSRLIACLDVYQALIEERPYRGALSHHEAMELMKKMTDDGLLDGKIIGDIDNIFGNTTITKI